MSEWPPFTMTRQERRRQRLAFWTENHLPVWTWTIMEWLGCKLLGHSPIVYDAPMDERFDSCGWCQKSMPFQAHWHPERPNSSGALDEV